MSYLFILNPISGPASKRKNIRDLIFLKIGKKAEIVVTAYAGHASELANEALNKGIKNIVAVGGDGTMNEVASVLVNKKVNFGLIPMGSGNGFARSLGISLNQEKALQILKRKQTKIIDSGSANGIYFFVVSGIGFEANVAKRFQESKKRGLIPYFINGIKELSVYGYPNIKISSKELSSEINPLTVAIANAPQYGNNAIISPNSDMRDGFLDICILNKINLIQCIKVLKYLFDGRIDTIESYTTFKSQRITITANEKISFHTDGEVHKLTDKVIFEIIPKSLNVIC